LRRKAGAADPETLAAANNLANMRLARGDLAGAHALMLSVHGTLKQLRGAEHPDVLVCANSLSKTLLARGDVAEARLLLESTLEAQRRVEGPEHIRTLTTANNLAEILRAQGDLKEAHKLHRYVYETRDRVLGAKHMDTLMSANNLGLTLQAQGDHAAARTLLETVYQAGRDRLGEEHSDTLTAALNLAETLRAVDDFAGALKLQKMVHETGERLLGEEHPQTLLAANNRAGTLQVAGKLAEAGRLHERVQAILQRVLGPAHALTVGSADNRASLFQESGDLPRSAEICLSALDALTQAVAVDSTALTIVARLPILRSPHLAWPAASLVQVGDALPALSQRVMRQLRSMPLDSGASLFKAMLLLHDRWCVFVHHHAPADQCPQRLLAAIGALHGTNAWAQLREAVQDTDARSHSPAAQRYLQSEQKLQSSAQEIHDLLQQRDAMREQGAPGEALRPLQQKLDALARQDKLLYESLVEAERQLAAEDPVFAEGMRTNETMDWPSLQDSLDEDDVWLVPMPQDVIQLSDSPGQWAAQVGDRHSDVYVVRRSHPPSIVPTTSLPALVAATRLYRQGLQGTSRGLLRDGLPATSPDTPLTATPPQTDDATLAIGEEGPLTLVRYLTREGFWAPLLPLLKGVRRLHLVTGPGQHDMMLECGLPEELADLQVLRYCGLPAYRRRRMTDPGEATARSGSHAESLPEPTWICDPAWDTQCPIPFTTLDALLPNRQGRGRPQDVKDLLAHGPYSPLLVISSHGQSSGSRDNPSGAILIGDLRIAAPMLARGRRGQPHQVQRPTRFVVALSCFGGVVGATSQGDAHGVIAALQGLGLRWAIACLAPVPDFYTPLFSAVLHHELAKPGVDPADALVRSKRIVLQGPWDETLRREALDPLRQGYRELMQAILDEALSGHDASGTEPSPRALRLLRSLLGWPIQAKIQRALASALASAAEQGRTEAVALLVVQGQIRDALRQPGRRDTLIDDALDALFSGPTGWASNREHGGPMTSCVTALQSLCAVTVFFGRQ
jgi:tetratricopeptide (TPR) repeat protein